MRMMTPPPRMVALNRSRLTRARCTMVGTKPPRWSNCLPFSYGFRNVPHDLHLSPGHHVDGVARAQRNQVAALVWIAPHLRTVLASHIALKLMDWRRLRSADDVERDGRMRVAAKTAHFKIAVAGIEGIAKRGRRLGRPPEAEHALVPRLAGQPIGFL